MCARFAQTVDEHVPHLGEEMRGIAEGAELPVSSIVAINARTELLTDLRISECTAVGVGSHAKLGNDTVLAQNWDWSPAFRGLTRVVTVRPAGRPAMKLLIEPGMVGKIGLNDAGVGVCLNFLYTETPNPDGLPVHVLLRAVLECTTAQAADDMISQAPRAAAANFLVGDAGNQLVSLETRPSRVDRLRGRDYVAHTNSFNADGERCGRQWEFEQALRAFRDANPDQLLSPAALRRSFTIPNVEFPVCRGPYGTETIHTIILNLSQRRMLVSGGAASRQFDTHTLTA